MQFYTVLSLYVTLSLTSSHLAVALPTPQDVSVNDPVNAPTEGR